MPNAPETSPQETPEDKGYVLTSNQTTNAHTYTMVGSVVVALAARYGLQLDPITVAAVVAAAYGGFQWLLAYRSADHNTVKTLSERVAKLEAEKDELSKLILGMHAQFAREGKSDVVDK